MNPRPGRLVALISIGVAAALLAPATLAQGSPIDDKKAEAARLQDAIESNGNRIEVLAEQYNGAVVKLQQANEGIADAEVRVEAAKNETNRLQGVLNGRAAELYKAAGTSAGSGSSSTADITDQTTREKYAAAAASKDNSTIDQLRRAQEDLAVQKQQYEAAKIAAQGEKDSLASSQRQLERLNANQQQLLDKTKGELADLVKQEEQRRKQEEARRAAAEQARRVAAARAARGGGGGNGGAGAAGAAAARNSAANVARVPAPSPGAQAAVEFALAQVGKPYQYGAAGPDSYDCSGLTMMAWRAGGISLPHYSGAQAQMFPQVPDDQIKPGDLVLYYGDLHHVSIAINGSQAVSAPHTGDFVKVVPIFRSAYQFAVRPG